MQAELFDIEKKTVSSERNRISLELHDHVANKLAVLLQQVRNKKITEIEITNDLNEITQDVRYLSHALSPLNESEDFEDTLREWALHLQNKTGIKIHVDSSILLNRIKGNQLLHLFRIIQEAVSNAIKHGQANNVFIQFSELEGQFIIGIEDDGKGFNSNIQNTGLGLKHMRARATYINAELIIQSNPNQGTYIQLILKLSS
jgi:signal transduction histidine kinase